MNDYVGKICPFCKTEFQPGEEIVVCSDCDMPHHKDCWIENQGCTTFGCLGTIKSTGSSTTSVTAGQMSFADAATKGGSAVVYCTRCGKSNEATSLFCEECGNRLTTAVHTTQPPNRINYSNPANASSHTSVNQMDTIYQQLIGARADYYLHRFQKMKTQNKQISWNWPAFLIAPYWMIYRKMYGYGIGVLAGSLIISLIGSSFLSLLMLIGYVAIGIFANNIYMKSIESRAAQAQLINEPFKSQFIFKNSGTNATAAVLTAIGYVVIVGIFYIYLFY